MRVTYLHQYFNTPQMPGGTRSYEIARRLAANGHQVTIVTSRRDGSGPRVAFAEEVDGVEVRWLPVEYSNAMSYSDRMKAFAKFAYLASREAARIPADVVLATSTPLTIAVPAVHAAKRLAVPMVFEVRDLWPELPIAVGAIKNPLLIAGARRLERYAYEHAAHVIALSPGMKEGVVKAGYPEDRVTVVPNAADLELFARDEADAEAFLADKPALQGRPVILYAGTIGIINGVSYLVRIAEAAHALGIDASFVVVGDGKERDAVRKEAKRRGVLGTNFFMYAPLPKTDMPAVFAAADVAVSLFIDLEPMWANSANKFFDAIASGTPVAINYGGWQADLIDSCGIGVRLPAADAEQAAGLLGDFMADRQAVARSGAAARSLAEREFDRDVLVSRIERILDSVVGGRA